MTITVLTGDCRDILKTLPDQSIHTCVTSPPYFGLRDYGVADQIGLEQTPEAFVNELVAVFREVRRVLRDDGTLWLNLGDSYCNSNGFARASPEYQREGRNNMPANDRKLDKLHEVGLKTKDLIGIPWMVAFALRADGWYLRQDIIWHKPNPMPESVQDRCTKAHEYIFLLSKSPKYYFDHEAIKEDSVDPESHKGMKLRSADKRVGDKYFATKVGNHAVGKIYAKKNKRSVWTVTTKPFKGAHFATFPLDLIEPCILAGCPEGGIVLDPFGGAGTTGLVANKHKRDAILIELNADYVDIINNRVNSPIQDKLL